MFIRGFGALRTALFLLLALVLSRSTITTAQEPITIRVAGPPNEGYKDVYYAVQSGLFKKYGLDVQTRITNGGAVVLAGLVGGSYEIAYSNLVPVLEAHLRGVGFQIVAPSTMFQSDQTQNAMLVAKDSPLRTAHDLNGKTIGTQSLQDLNSIAMRAWIDKNGGDATTVHVLEVPSAAAVQSLIAHRIDAMALSEPLLGEALATGKVRIFAKPQTAIADRFQAQAVRRDERFRGAASRCDGPLRQSDARVGGLQQHTHGRYRATRVLVHQRSARRHRTQRARDRRRVCITALHPAADRRGRKIRDDPRTVFPPTTSSARLR